MNFKFNLQDWSLKSLGQLYAQQFDNLTVPLRFIGNFPEEFTVWHALLKFGSYTDEISLTAIPEGYECLLSESQLAFNGIYEIQLKAENDAQAKYSSIAYVSVGKSIGTDTEWPEIPTAFSQAVRRAEEASAAAEDAKAAAEEAARAAEAATSGKIDKSAQLEKTAGMTQRVGIDENGSLWVPPGGGGGGNVLSVNGKTGDVELDAEDVGALPSDTPLFSGSYNDLTDKPTIPTVPTNVSAFFNDAGYLTQHQDISGKVDKVDGKGLSTNDYTDADQTKLDGIAAGAEVNVQSDWSQTDSTADDFIKNKPSIATTAEVEEIITEYGGNE